MRAVVREAFLRALAEGFQLGDVGFIERRCMWRSVY
jgi:hypothetical protein